jgi:hypothetical protein
VPTLGQRIGALSARKPARPCINCEVRDALACEDALAVLGAMVVMIASAPGEPLDAIEATAAELGVYRHGPRLIRTSFRLVARLAELHQRDEGEGEGYLAANAKFETDRTRI